jgi:hypothetical protein
LKRPEKARRLGRDRRAAQESREILRVVLLIGGRGRHPVVCVALVGVLASPVCPPILNPPSISSAWIESSVHSGCCGCTTQRWGRPRASVGIRRFHSFLLLDSGNIGVIINIFSTGLVLGWALPYPSRYQRVVVVVVIVVVVVVVVVVVAAGIILRKRRDGDVVPAARLYSRPEESGAAAPLLRDGSASDNCYFRSQVAPLFLQNLGIICAQLDSNLVLRAVLKPIVEIKENDSSAVDKVKVLLLGSQTRAGDAPCGNDETFPKRSVFATSDPSNRARSRDFRDLDARL